MVPEMWQGQEHEAWSMQMSKQRILGCKYCKQTGHFEFACRMKPRKPLAKGHIKKTGKHYSLWMQTRRKWLVQNKAEYYICHYCPRVMTRSQLTLDHKESRGRHPELRYTLSNLVPCCAPCNKAKGSLSAEEFLQKRRVNEDA